jgi:hypothetical protein
MINTDEKTQRLNFLLPHWIEHTSEHAAEFREWAENAGMAKADLIAAAEQFEGANLALQAALSRLEK